MTTINIRIDENLKNQSAQILSSLGLDISSAVKMFLTKVVDVGGIPFQAVISAAKKAELDREVAEALKGPGYKTADEMFRAILSKEDYENWK